MLEFTDRITEFAWQHCRHSKNHVALFHISIYTLLFGAIHIRRFDKNSTDISARITSGSIQCC